MAGSIAEPTTRTVVLLKPKERKKLDRLAASQRTSSGEILRRSLRAYDPANQAENPEILASMFAEMNAALDNALQSIEAARIEIRQNLKKIERSTAGAK
jgi:hypothetical protein